MTSVYKTLVTLSFAAVASLSVPVALADSSDASCEVHRKGDLIKKASGPCQFSQRQGNITITLKNGNVWNLRGTDMANNYRDNDNHNVTRHMEGQAHVYKWQHRNIKVSFNSAGNSQGGGVPQAQMARFCQGEASSTLSVRPTEIMTESVRRQGGRYIVEGQTPPSGSNATKFKCTFDGNGQFENVVVTQRGGNHHQSNNRPNQGTIPPAARARCLNNFGGGASTNVRTVSALRPGFWEVIMDSQNRSVACTVTDAGQIEDWVELN